jgi:ABC-type polysaccharide/polyol phosphate export permease
MTGSPRRWDLARGLDVVRELAVADFRLKYYDSALGYAWSMLSPLLMLAIYYLVFRYVLGVQTPGYLVYLVVGIVYWTFFQDCSFSGMVALQSKSGILRALPVPPLVVVAGGAASTLITLGINTAALLVALALAGRLSPLAPLAVYPIFLLALLAASASLGIAAAWVHFRDAGLIWSVLSQACFWATPVVWVAEPGPIADLAFLNPLARCLFLIRWFLVYEHLPTLQFLLTTTAACATLFLLALAAFARTQRRLAEHL